MASARSDDRRRVEAARGSEAGDAFRGMRGPDEVVLAGNACPALGDEDGDVSDSIPRIAPPHTALAQAQMWLRATGLWVRRRAAPGYPDNRLMRGRYQIR